jgi:hypothetical protein
MLGLSFVFVYFGIIDRTADTVTQWLRYAELVIYLAFIYRGHRWAIIVVMLLWTGDKLTQGYDYVSTGHGAPPDIAILLVVGFHGAPL